MPQLPMHCQLHRDGPKILGLFFGTEQYMQGNWDGLREKVLGRLQRWEWIRLELSYRGRELVVNSLAASMLWHRLTASHLSSEELCELFSGWESLASSWGPLFSCGGRRTRPYSLRLQIAYNETSICPETVVWYGSAMGGVWSSLHEGWHWITFLSTVVLLPHINSVQVWSTSFYRSVVEAWRLLRVERMEHYALNKPLFFNPYWLSKSVISEHVVSPFYQSKCNSTQSVVHLA